MTERRGDPRQARVEVVRVEQGHAVAAAMETLQLDRRPGYRLRPRAPVLHHEDVLGGGAEGELREGLAVDQ